MEQKNGFRDGEWKDFHRPFYKESVAELAALLETKPDLAEIVASIIATSSPKLRRVAVYAVPAESTAKSPVRLEPSDLFLELLGAVRTDALDKILVVKHLVQSP